jgi:hypothetical protein
MPKGPQGQAPEPTKSAMHQGCRPWPAHEPGWLVERLRLGVGHASTVRPDPSALGVVGERGSRHEGRSPARSRKLATTLATPSGTRTASTATPGGATDSAPTWETLRPLRLGFVSFRHPANPDQIATSWRCTTNGSACVRAGGSRSAVWAPQGGDGQMQVPRTQQVSGCRECGAGSVLGTPVATTGRATKKENHHDDSADGQHRHCRRRP